MTELGPNLRKFAEEIAPMVAELRRLWEDIVRDPVARSRVLARLRSRSKGRGFVAELARAVESGRIEAVIDLLPRSRRGIKAVLRAVVEALRV